MKRVPINRFCSSFSAWAFLGLLATAGSALAQITYTNLFDFGSVDNQAGASAAYAAPLRGLGQWVGSVQSNGASNASLWTEQATAGINLHPSGGFIQSSANGTNGVKQVGYGQHISGASHAMMWSGSAESVVDLHPTSGFADTFAHAVGGSQQVGDGIIPGMEFLPRALLWSGTADSVVDLTPVGYSEASAYATSGTQQVGSARPQQTENSHAMLWSGTAASRIDLNPPEYRSSVAFGVGGTQQVGNGNLVDQVGGHALLWTGSADSVVDLHPAAFFYSFALATDGTCQVGYGKIENQTGERALVWSGSADSMIDLHSVLPPEYTFSRALAVSGDTVYGFATSSDFATYHAIVWHIPEPATLGSIIAGVMVLLRRTRSRAAR